MNISAIVLAAGKGTRMNSDRPKVLHEIGGKPMVQHILEKLVQLSLKQIIVVVGYGAEEVKSALGPGWIYVVQENPAGGTADAVKSGLTKVTPYTDTILVLGGDDSSFYRLETLKDFLAFHPRGGNIVSAITTSRLQGERAGRVIRDANGNFKLTMEVWEYENSGFSSDEVNCGAYLFNADWLRKNIGKIDNSNERGEYRITEALNIAHNQGEKIGIYKLGDSSEWIGVNTLEDLEKANKLMGDK